MPCMFPAKPGLPVARFVILSQLRFDILEAFTAPSPARVTFITRLISPLVIVVLVGSIVIRFFCVVFAPVSLFLGGVDLFCDSFASKPTGNASGYDPDSRAYRTSCGGACRGSGRCSGCGTGGATRSCP